MELYLWHEHQLKLHLTHQELVRRSILKQQQKEFLGARSKTAESDTTRACHTVRIWHAAENKAMMIMPGEFDV